MRWLWLLPLIASCAMNADVGSGQLPPLATTSDDCATAPMAARGKYRHRRNRLYQSLGEPRFRGVDLIAVESDESQTLGGKLAYTAADKDVWDEDVEIFACMTGSWQSIARARTDAEGRFQIALTGMRRLPAGMRDLYLHAPGEGGGVRFIAYVAPRDASVIVTDVDGTITASENAVFKTVLLADDIAHQPHAPASLAAAKLPVVYLTSRGDQYTEVTRQWLARHGFPRGPLRLASSVVTIPGDRTVEFKTRMLLGLRVRIAAGIGNRASDIAAYTAAGLAPQQIFINLPEFSDEVRDPLANGEATAFDDYRELPARLAIEAAGTP